MGTWESRGLGREEWDDVGQKATSKKACIQSTWSYVACAAFLILDLMPHHTSSFSASSQLLSNPSNGAHLLFPPSGYGMPKAAGATPSSHPHLFLITAFLAERPPAPPTNPPAEVAARLEQQVAALQEVRATDQAPTRLSSPLSKLQIRRRKPRAAENEMGIEDTQLESKWVHRVWVASGSLAMVGVMGKAMEAAGTTEERVGMMAAAVGAYIAADLATGIYHWGVDNYGDAKTPIFGPQIDAFQGHHKRPWTIAKRQFANNIHALARPATFALAPFLLLPSHAYVDSFLAVFLACVVYSQQFHAWAHAKKKDVPALVSTLQDSGLLVSRKMHGAHHSPPYNVNYCIVSGLWNPLLDRVDFFATLEKLIFSTSHVRPRSWTETSTDWLQDGSYFSDGTDVDDTSSQLS